MPRKSLRIVLHKNLNKLGKAGELTSVAPGYFRNYLAPNHLASRATKQKLKQIEQLKIAREQQLNEEINLAQKTKQTLESFGKLSIKKKTGEKRYMFGQVTEKEVSELIKQNIGLDIDRKQIFLPEIRSIGTYQLRIRLYSDTYGNLKINVLPL